MSAPIGDPAQCTVPTAFPAASCIRRGHASVGASRMAAPIKIYYELHGDKSDKAEKVVFIAGLNQSCWSWEHQLAHFSSRPGYQFLTLDNRGVGNSDAPTGRYKTSEMAQDAIELFDYLGWTEPRSVHLCGWSMGGMISQEIALAVPERLASLTLLSTKPGGKIELPSYAVGSMLVKIAVGLLKPKDALPVVAALLFPTAWLDEQATDGSGRTNKEIELEQMARRFKIGRRQTSDGSKGHLTAVWGHAVHADRLKRIGEEVPRVAIVTGDDDHFIHHSWSDTLHKGIPGSTLLVKEKTGHAPMIQHKEEFNKLMESIIAEGRAKSA